MSGVEPYIVHGLRVVVRRQVADKQRAFPPLVRRLTAHTSKGL